jgi:hypothetical protein
MLRDVLEHIGKNYLPAKDEPFKGHPLGRFIRKDGPDEVARVIADPQLIAKGGYGGETPPMGRKRREAAKRG